MPYEKRITSEFHENYFTNMNTFLLLQVWSHTKSRSFWFPL